MNNDKKADNPAKLDYVSPEINVLEVFAEQGICLSSDSWYDKGGYGDFGHTTDNDIYWS